MRRDGDKFRQLTHYLADRLNYRCEVCGRSPDWRGLAGAHIIRRSKGIKSAPDKAWNVLIACGICHDHNKYANGLPITEEQALEIARRRNEKLCIDPEYDGA